MFCDTYERRDGHWLFVRARHRTGIVPDLGGVLDQLMHAELGGAVEALPVG